MATLACQPNYRTFLIQDCLLLEGSQNVSTSTQCHYPDIGSTYSPQMIAIQFSQFSVCSLRSGLHTALLLIPNVQDGVHFKTI
jgi:hypothetical protein